MEGSAILTLLKAHSQNNSYSQAVHSTYLMATGAQRQHFTVLSSLGISMGYTSVINKYSGLSTLATSELTNQVSQTAIEPSRLPSLAEETAPVNDQSDTTPKAIPSREPGKKTKRKWRTLGTLFQLSASCRATARLIARTRLLVIVYDNINMMVRIAEQILGRKSKHI